MFAELCNARTTRLGKRATRNITCRLVWFLRNMQGLNVAIRPDDRENNMFCSQQDFITVSKRYAPTSSGWFDNAYISICSQVYCPVVVYFVFGNNFCGMLALRPLLPTLKYIAASFRRSLQDGRHTRMRNIHLKAQESYLKAVELFIFFVTFGIQNFSFQSNS